MPSPPAQIYSTELFACKAITLLTAGFPQYRDTQRRLSPLTDQWNGLRRTEYDSDLGQLHQRAE